jgi:hypothetical protein
MSRRITDLDSPEFAALFSGFQHTAYRLERWPWYGVGYEDATFAAWRAGHPVQDDPARDAWTGMVRDAVAAGKVFQRVHLLGRHVAEMPAGALGRRLGLTDYLVYEFEHWYAANVAAGDDVRIWAEPAGGWPDGLPQWDYWLFDSRDLWAMHYDDVFRFVCAEQIEDPAVIVQCNYWRDAALRNAVPFADYIHRSELLAAS